MPRIIVRYLNREIINTMLIITAILLAILICNQFVRYLGDAAMGRMTAKSVMQMMSIQVPLLAGFLLPLGFFLAVLISYGRLYTTNEMTAFFCAGFSRFQLLGATLIGASITTLVVGALMMWVEPQMTYYRERILAEAVAASPLQKMTSGRFQFIAGRYVVYAEKMSRNRDQLENVFAAEMPLKNHFSTWGVMVAHSAKQVKDSATQQEFVEFQKGFRYQGNPGEQAFQLVAFDHYGVRLPTPKIKVKRDEDYLSTVELWRERNTNRLAAAQLQWRFSMPLSVLLLTLIAVPLSRANPRQGRFAQLFPGIIIYIVYVDLLFVSRSWVEHGVVSTSIGLWWVHGMIFVLGLGLFLQYTGHFRKWRMRFLQ
ncbi:MAG: LPS export ABC transporter permease LptF [Gammaproteobacteria bacterium]|nr:LPS export ABC transporter permease LptF [Gammaproteobacteria bacterium]